MMDNAEQLDGKQRMEDMLNSEVIGHLGLCADDETYVVPLNFTYADGQILFHCALEGAKLDVIKRNPRVCVEVSRMEGTPTPHGPDSCDSAFSSVICWGTARILEDVQERQAVLNSFLERYNTEAHHREPISLEQAEKCGGVAITVERMTGRFFASKEADDRYEWRK